ncbi:hypothetical protein BLNAU_1145 [Blattamonas nauphoetae]|uniref:FPL domain-containing protein n=1 Tax=Blattamonas nauphoetae TaxID=2049346 RepID=A0ABQ9YJX7_9EUKA|nr:hypothetical protein BLNAU_1145 [Blattamonas nauphoetae]
MTEIVEKTDTSSSQARSALSSSQFPFSKDCDPFLKWNEDPRDSGHEQAIVFRSLVATLQLQSALDDSLEAKAVRFLESMYLDDEDLAETFLSNFASFSGESLTNFVQSIVVLISSASNVITTAAMKMLKTLFSNCSPQVQLTLVKAELIPQLITTLNPQSVSLSDCQHIHTCLILCIINSVWLSTPYGLTSLEIEDRDEQQAVRETVFQQVLVPSEKYIWHLCKNRFSIIEREQSIAFMALLADLLQISPYYQPTMDLNDFSDCRDDSAPQPQIVTFVLNDWTHCTVACRLATPTEDDLVVSVEFPARLAIPQTTLTATIASDSTPSAWKSTLGMSSRTTIWMRYRIRHRLHCIHSFSEFIHALQLQHDLLPPRSQAMPPTASHSRCLQPMKASLHTLFLFPFSTDCDPFLKWNEVPLDSEHEQAIIFRSLVATLQLQPVLDDSLEAKAVRLLESLIPSDGFSAYIFLHHVGRAIDESLTDFVQFILVLVSSTSQVITTASMKMLKNLIRECTTNHLLTLVKADLIPQLIATFDPPSLSFTEAEDVHTSLLDIILNPVWLATPTSLTYLEIEDRDGQQAVRKAVFQQVLAPSEKYIWHLCVNRYSIIDGDQSTYFLALLAGILEISP